VRTALVTVVLVLLNGCGKPPQIGADGKSFKGVDALYTAVTARDPKLLNQCAKNLQDLKIAGKLPEPAFHSLEAIIAKARDGNWQSAAADLTWFMKGQRRPSKHG